jgi:LysM repeat protein
MKLNRRQLRKLIIEALDLREEKKELPVGQYPVKSGDTLSGITKAHSPDGVTVKDNANLNSMEVSDDIYPDQILKIYVKDEYEGEFGPPKVD